MKKALLVVVTGDKGLAGAFNTNVIRRARQEIKATAELDLMLIGRRGVDFFRRRSQAHPLHPRHSPTSATRRAAAIAREIAEAFERRDYDAVYVVYNQFVSVITQKLTFERLLPLEAGVGERRRRPPRATGDTRGARLHLRAFGLGDPRSRGAAATSRTRSTASCSTRRPPSSPRR